MGIEGGGEGEEIRGGEIDEEGTLGTGGGVGGGGREGGVER